MADRTIYRCGGTKPTGIIHTLDMELYPMIGYTINQRGRYKCSYCDHSTYKTAGGIMQHLDKNHSVQLKLDHKDAEIERLKNMPPKIEVREKIVYKEKPEPKYWYIENGGGVYCETCKTVQMRVGIPQGQTIENTPHSCGNRTLKLVLEVR